MQANLHLAPKTLHLVPYTLYPIPCTLNLVPYTLNLLQIQRKRFKAKGQTGFRHHG